MWAYTCDPPTPPKKNKGVIQMQQDIATPEQLWVRNQSRLNVESRLRGESKDNVGCFSGKCIFVPIKNLKKRKRC